MSNGPISNIPNADGSGFQNDGLGRVNPVPSGGGGSGSSTDYDPGAVQQMLMSAMKGYGPGKPMTEGVLMYVMYLMHAYTQQNLGLDAGVQTKLTKYTNQVQELYNDLNAANGYTGPASADPSIDFKKQLDSLLDSLSSDGFFTTGQGHEMVDQITDALGALTGYVSSGDGQGGLERLWAEGNAASGTGLTASNPTKVSTAIATLGELTQQYTGLSAVLKTVITTDTATSSAALDYWTNALKKYNQVDMFLLNQQKTQ